MDNLRAICRPQAVFSTVFCYRNEARSFIRIPFQNTNHRPSLFSPWLESKGNRPWFRVNQWRTAVRASNWSHQKSPYQTLVYDGKGSLEEGETAEARFIKIQAAHELLLDQDKRRQYDIDNRVNPMKASQAWMEWLMKKRKAFDQRGDMAIVAWAEQQQREMKAEEEKRKVISQLLAVEGLELETDEDAQ